MCDQSREYSGGLCEIRRGDTELRYTQNGGSLDRMDGKHTGLAELQDDRQHLLDFRWNSGGGAHALPAVGLLKETHEDFFDVGKETSLQNCVGFVED